jgi:hypothetical protein
MRHRPDHDDDDAQPGPDDDPGDGLTPPVPPEPTGEEDLDAAGQPLEAEG